MHKFTFNKSFFLPIFLFLLASDCFAASLQTQVTRFSGSLDSGFVVGDSIANEENITTDLTSTLDFSIDQTVGVRLLPDTTARIEQSPEGHPVLFVEKGNVLLNVLKMNSGKEFSVKTPTAVASVRGTQFWGRVLPSGVDSGNTFAVREGTVEIQLLKTGQRTLVHAGEAIDLSDNVNSLRVRPALEAELQAMIAADQIAISA